MAILVILLVLQDVLSIPINPEVTTEQRHTFLCARAIMAHYFTPDRLTVVVIPDSSHDVYKRQRILGSDNDVNMRQGTLGDNHDVNMDHILGSDNDVNMRQGTLSDNHDVNMDYEVLGSDNDVNTRQGTLGDNHDVNMDHDVLGSDNDVNVRRRISGSDHDLSMQHSFFLNPHHYHSDHYLTDFMMQALSQEARWPFTVVRQWNSGTQPAVPFEQQSQYLIILWPMDHQVLSALSRIIQSRTPSNTKGLLIVVLTDDFLLQDKELRLEILRNATDHPTHNAIIVVPTLQYKYTNLDHDTDISNVLDLYTWIPTGADKYCGEFRELVRINHWLMEGDGRFLNELNLFPDKTPTGIQGCTITVYDVHKPFNTASSPITYLERHILELIMDSLNVTVTLVEKWTDAEIIYGGFRINMARVQPDGKMHVSYPHLSIALKWYVECGSAIPRQGNFTTVFAWPVWLALFLACLLAVLATFWIYKSSHEHRGVSECFLMVWAVAVGTSVPQNPHTCRLRVFFLMWMCYSFSLSIVFQGFFTSFLVQPGLQKQTSTLEEMLHSGVKCLFTIIGASLWCDNKLDVCSHCSPQCNDTLICLDNLLEPANYAVLANELDMEVMLPYLSKEYLYCTTKDEVVETAYAMLVSKKSSAIDIINTKIFRITEAGIVDKLRRESVIHARNRIGTERQNSLTKRASPSLKTSSKNAAASDDDKESDYFVFTISHLQVAFYLLITGHSVSCATLLIEILTYNRQCRFNLCRQRI
jgi:hypothetical protein